MSTGSIEQKLSPITVFISYSQGSDKHNNQVRSFSDRLVRNGVDCILDSYVCGSPPSGWVKWMMESTQKADFIIIVCNKDYFNRFRGLEQPLKGQGVKFESTLILEDMYYSDSNLSKMIPIFFNKRDKNFIPPVLKSATQYCLSDEAGYENVYRVLTDQPKIKKPELGEIIRYDDEKPVDNTEKTDAQVTLSVDYDSFSEEDAEIFLQALKQLLSLDNDIVIKKIRKGSVIIDLELSTVAATKLKALAESGKLDSLHVTAVALPLLEKLERKSKMRVVTSNLSLPEEEVVRSSYISGVAVNQHHVSITNVKESIPSYFGIGTDIQVEDFSTIEQKAKIPDLSGFSQDVLSVLQQSIGSSSVSVESVAEKLGLSKRTLQRYLRHENQHFGALRDVVRFNSAITCLLKYDLSVAETAKRLDYADTTSFTYAFKRWTNMSPSVFRKIYRDYI